MYLDGKGKTQDYNMAAEQFNKGIEASGEYIYNYYELARAYVSLDKYADAQTQIDTYLQIATDSLDLSDGYNVKGICYMSTGDNTSAKAMFNKALELNPDNEYAQSNLTLLK